MLLELKASQARLITDTSFYRYGKTPHRATVLTMAIAFISAKIFEHASKKEKVYSIELPRLYILEENLEKDEREEMVKELKAYFTTLGYMVTEDTNGFTYFHWEL